MEISFRIQNEKGNLKDTALFKETLYEHSDAVTSISICKEDKTKFLSSSWDQT
jgi:hypothetical protein